MASCCKQWMNGHLRWPQQLGHSSMCYKNEALDTAVQDNHGNLRRLCTINTTKVNVTYIQWRLWRLQKVLHDLHVVESRGLVYKRTHQMKNECGIIQTEASLVGFMGSFVNSFHFTLTTTTVLPKPKTLGWAPPSNPSPGQLEPSLWSPEGCENNSSISLCLEAGLGVSMGLTTGDMWRGVDNGVEEVWWPCLPSPSSSAMELESLNLSRHRLDS